MGVVTLPPLEFVCTLVKRCHHSHSLSFGGSGQCGPLVGLLARVFFPTPGLQSGSGHATPSRIRLHAGKTLPPLPLPLFSVEWATRPACGPSSERILSHPRLIVNRGEYRTPQCKCDIFTSKGQNIHNNIKNTCKIVK